MSTASRNGTSKSNRVFDRALQAAALAAVASLVFAAPSRADTNYYYGGASTDSWDTTTVNWASPTPTSPLTTWTSSSTSDAIFPSDIAATSGGNTNINVNQNITADSLNFLQTGTVSLLGNSTITLNSIGNTVGSQAVNFTTPLGSPGQLVIQGVPYPQNNGSGVSLLANTNDFANGILLTGGSVYLNLGNTAKELLVDPTHVNGLAGASFNSPTGFVGADGQPSNIQTGPITLTTVSGAGGVGFPAITVDGNGSTIDLAKININDYVLPNPIVLNPSNASNFYVGLGAGSVNNSGKGTTTGPYPQYATMNFSGQISGNGNVIICNDFYGGGGKGFTVFSNPNNNYTGKTIVNNNGQNYLTFQIGAQGAIPATSDLVFGANSVGQAIGDTQISHKQIGAMDLNGFDSTVKSLSSDLSPTVFALGITSVDNHALDPNLTSGPHATDGSNTSTLTIDSAGAFNNTFFQGNIADGTDFLTQDNASNGTYHGSYLGSATNYLPPTDGLKVALKLAPTNTGVLTLTASNGGNIPDYGYSGGTTISGGSLYVNGPLTAASGNTTTQVLVTTPTAGNVALLGGTGSINPDIHLQSGATLAPGSAPVPLATGSGSSFTALPTAFNIGTLTVKNLTMDGGSQFNFVINDGSATAVAGIGFGNLAFTAGGSFTENASVTAADPIYLHPLGNFSGFANYKSATWDLANFPAGTTLANITMDTRNGYSPLPAALLANGTFSVTEAGTALDLVFTPSPTVTALQYSGPASGTWNSNTSNTIWTDLVHGAGSTFYADPANVLFATPTSNTTITVQPAGVSPASVIFNNAGTAFTYTLAGGSINGAAPLSLNGSGHVILTATNAYTGGTGISGGGTLETQIDGALGSGDISIYNGTWATTTTDQTYSLNVQVLGSGSASPATTSTIQTGPLTGSPSGNLTLNGNIAGGGTFTKTGLGTLIVNGSLTQSGDLDVNGGNLVINGTVANSGTTNVAASAGIEYNTAANAGIGFTTAANLAGNLTFDNITSITFSPGTYPVQGNLILKASGTEVQGVGGQIGGPAVDIGATILMNPGNTPNFISYVGMPGNGNNFWLHGPITGNGSVDFGAGPGQGGGADLALYAQSTYTGTTYLTTGGGSVLTLQTNNALPTTTQVVFGINGSGGGSIDLNGFNQTVAGIQTDPSGGGFGGITDSAGGGTLTVDGSTSTEFNAEIQGILNLTIALQDNAVLDLSYNGNNNGTSSGNIYLGQTTVTSGVLRFSSPLAFSPNTNVMLDGGVLEIHAHGFQSVSNPTGAFTASLGASFGQLQITGGVSGFSSFGSVPGSFNLNGDGSTIVWGSTFFQPSVLVLNQTTATNTLTFMNGLDLNGADRTITVNSTLAGTGATISGVISNSSGTAGLIKTGPGTLALAAVNTYNGDTTVSAGELDIASGGSIASTNVAVANGATLAVLSGGTVSTSTNLTNSGTVNFSNGSAVIAALTNAVAGAQVNLNSTTLKTASFTQAGTTGAWASGLNLAGNGKFILESTPASKPTAIAQLQDQVKSGMTSTNGIFSSTLPSNYGIAVADNQVTNFSTFGGVAVDPNSILVAPELLGDTNLDGHVNSVDLQTILNNFGKPTLAWTDGNFDGAATIDLTDLADVLNNFGQFDGNSSESPKIAAVPEPASLALLGLGAVAVLRRRRKA